jgi:hypothetical protein
VDLPKRKAPNELNFFFRQLAWIVYCSFSSIYTFGCRSPLSCI